MITATRSRLLKGALVFFAAGALIGAAFAIVGPVPVIRIFGLVALALAAVGSALELYALRHFDPRAYAALRQRLSQRSGEAGAASARRSTLAHSVVLSHRHAAMP